MSNPNNIQSHLAHKLGIKENYRIAIIDAPLGYFTKLGPLPKGAKLNWKFGGKRFDLIQIFAEDAETLESEFAQSKEYLKETGAIWVSWPKKSSEVSTTASENLVRSIGLKQELVDVKICSIDETWSGLKFVYRLKDRKKKKSRNSARH